jgi:DNA adenine methylase
MQYMGSKSRISRKFLPLLLAERTQNQTWVEPFVGGGHVIEHVNGPRIGSDSNKYIIALLQAIQSGWTPPTSVSQQEYNDIRADKDAYPDQLVAFVGYACSFGGKWFGGYAKNSKGRNYALCGHNTLLKTAHKIKDVSFHVCDYRHLVIPDRSIVYCDPPYYNTTHYGTNFDHNEFWEWVREQCRNGHAVFVSEYTAPQDFVPVWKGELPNKLNRNITVNTTECIFVHSSQSMRNNDICNS